MKQSKLNITFHNPNTSEELIELLIMIAAETAKAQIIDKIHNEKSDTAAEEPPI